MEDDPFRVEEILVFQYVELKSILNILVIYILNIQRYKKLNYEIQLNTVQTCNHAYESKEVLRRLLTWDSCVGNGEGK